MKTTVEITDSLLKEAKAYAHERGVPLRSLVEDGLRTVLEKRHEKKKFVLRDGSVGGNGLITDLSPHEIIMMTYEGRGV